MENKNTKSGKHWVLYLKKLQGQGDMTYSCYPLLFNDRKTLIYDNYSTFRFKIYSNLISILSKQIQMTTTMKTFHLVVLNLRLPEKVLMKLLLYRTHARTYSRCLSVSHLQLQCTRKLPIIEII